MTERACHCVDFSRAELLRRAIAEPGRGLPAIEAGMPLPAGTGLDRRQFLARSAGLVLAVYGATRIGLPQFDAGIAQAAELSDGPVLVSVFLEGGADSMSILFPAGDSQYRKLRPRLALRASTGTVFAEDQRLHWHPSAVPLATLHEEGKLSVIPAVGYTHPDQSHFTSRHFWEVGATNRGLRTGWLGRYLDVAGSQDNPLQGLSLDGRLQPALASETVPVAAVDGPDRYRFSASGVWGEVNDRMQESLQALALSQADPDPAIMQAANTTLQAYRLSQELAPFQTPFSSPVPYPDSEDAFPRRMAGLAAMLGAGLPLRCVTITAPGMYDTHANQADPLARSLDLTSQTLLAFQRDLEARGLADRVIVQVWSEFGRRAHENGSRGTDHGAAGIGFLMGSRVRGEMIGEFPGLTTGLDHLGNLRPTADYRGIYSALLEQWFGTDAAAVIPDSSLFERPTLFR